MSLRFTTAGESHGPGLTAIVEGLPAGLELRPEDIDARPRPAPARPRPRRAHEDREGPRRGDLRRPPRAHARQPGRAADREPRLRELGGADEPVAGRGGRGRGAPAAPGSRRPGRASRSTASPTCATCSSARARARRPPALPAAALAKAFLRAFGVTVFSHVIADRRGATRPQPERPRSRPTSTGVDESPVRCLDAEASAGDGGRDRQRAARPTSRSAASSRCVRSGWSRASARTSPGRSASTAGWRRRSCRSRR